MAGVDGSTVAARPGVFAHHAPLLQKLSAGPAYPTAKPPSVSEPLLQLGAEGIQSSVAWLHKAVAKIASQIEAQNERQDTVTELLRSDNQQLRDRLESLETFNDDRALAGLAPGSSHVNQCGNESLLGLVHPHVSEADAEGLDDGAVDPNNTSTEAPGDAGTYATDHEDHCHLRPGMVESNLENGSRVTSHRGGDGAGCGNVESLIDQRIQRLVTIEAQKAAEAFLLARGLGTSAITAAEKVVQDDPAAHESGGGFQPAASHRLGVSSDVDVLANRGAGSDGAPDGAQPEVSARLISLSDRLEAVHGIISEVSAQSLDVSVRNQAIEKEVAWLRNAMGIDTAGNSPNAADASRESRGVSGPEGKCPLDSIVQLKFPDGNSAASANAATVALAQKVAQLEQDIDVLQTRLVSEDSDKEIVRDHEALLKQAMLIVEKTAESNLQRLGGSGMGAAVAPDGGGKTDATAAADASAEKTPVAFGSGGGGSGVAVAATRDVVVAAEVAATALKKREIDLLREDLHVETSPHTCSRTSACQGFGHAGALQDSQSAATAADLSVGAAAHADVAGLDAGSAVRLQSLEGQVQTFAHEVEGLRRQVRDALPGDGCDVTKPTKNLIGKEVECLRRDFRADNQALKETCLRHVTDEVRLLRQAAQSQHSDVDSAVADIEKRNEQRLTAMWTKLTSLAEAASVRANALEQNLLNRLQGIEATIKGIVENQVEDPVSAKDLEKHLEWLIWRISWLEWQAKGEKGSFSRPLDHRALPQPPPLTPAATAFAAPTTEDMELWTREQTTNRPRLRRRLPGAQTQALGGKSGLKEPDASVQPLRVTNSTGRLPHLGH